MGLNKKAKKKNLKKIPETQTIKTHWWLSFGKFLTSVVDIFFLWVNFLPSYPLFTSWLCETEEFDDKVMEKTINGRNWELQQNDPIPLKFPSSVQSDW